MPISEFDMIEQALINGPALEDIEDRRDFKLENFIAGAPPTDFPETFSLRDRQSSVKSQGSRGSCVGHAGTGVPEYFNRAEHSNPSLDLSEEFLFKKIKEIDIEDYGYDGYGSYLRSGAKALKKYGTCLESTLPYSPYEKEDFWKRVAISQKMTEEASLYKIDNYASAGHTIESFKNAMITTDAPIVAGIPIFENYREAKVNGGFFPKPSGKKIGNHAVLFTDWNKTHATFKNSWGTHWGDGGYCHWPISEFNFIFSPWSFIDLKNPKLDPEKIIESNRKLVPEWALDAWDKAIKKGLVNQNTLPNKTITKAEYFVLKDRNGELD
jgi:C1A family cysteine protease